MLHIRPETKKTKWDDRVLPKSANVYYFKTSRTILIFYLLSMAACPTWPDSDGRFFGGGFCGALELRSVIRDSGSWNSIFNSERQSQLAWTIKPNYEMKGISLTQPYNPALAVEVPSSFE